MKIRPALFAALVVLLVLCALALRSSPLGGAFTPEALAQAASHFRQSAAAPFWIFALFVTASLAGIPVVLLVTASAIVLGPGLGFACALCAATVSATLGFGIGRALGFAAVRRVAGSRFEALSRRLAQRGLLVVFGVRALPLAPFMIVNLVAGASPVRLRDFVLGSVLGLAPGALALSLFSDRSAAVLLGPSAANLAQLASALVLLAAVSILVPRWLRTPAAGTGAR